MRKRDAMPIPWKYGLTLVAMGTLYVAAGVNHFVMPQLYVSIMPPYIPHALGMVWVSGVAEILGGVGVLAPNGIVFRHSRSVACWGFNARMVDG